MAVLDAAERASRRAADVRDRAIDVAATLVVPSTPARSTTPVEAVKDLGLPNGVDHVFECVGHPALIRQGVDLLDWGGTLTLLGVPKLGTEAELRRQRRSTTTSRSSGAATARPARTTTSRCSSRFYQDGRLQLDEMVSQVYPLDRHPRRPSTTCTTASSTAACSPVGPLRRHYMEFGVFAQLFVPEFERDRRPATPSTSASCATSRSPRRPTSNAFKYVWCPQHHFLDEYSHMPGPEAFLGHCAGQHRAGPPRLGDLQHHAAGQQAGAHRRERRPARPPHRTTASSSAPAAARRPPRCYGFDIADIDETKAMWREAIHEIPKMWKKRHLLLRGHVLPRARARGLPEAARPVAPGHVGGRPAAPAPSPRPASSGLGAFCFSTGSPERASSRCVQALQGRRSPTPRRSATT